jgi:hypothetical protein
MKAVSKVKEEKKEEKNVSIEGAVKDGTLAFSNF